MKKTLKMSLLGMASVATLAAPVALAVSCGGTDSFVFKEASAAASTPITPNSVKVVTDGGTIDDKSFNQQAWEALGEIRRIGTGGTTPVKATDSLQPTPYGDTNKIVNSYRTYANDPKVSTILAPGFNHVNAMQRFITDYDNALNFILVDGEVPGPNVASITFKTDQAAFLAGNLAAQYLVDVKKDADPKVGTFGGGPFPGVTDFMKGFVEGIAYYNSLHPFTDTSSRKRTIEFVKLGTDSAYTNTGFAVGGGKSNAEKLVTDGADVILPVAGPQTLDVINAINQSTRKDIKIIGVDTDQSTMYDGSSTPNIATDNYSEMFLTSVKKEVKTAFVNVYKVMTGDTSLDDSFHGLGQTTVGDLDNQLVSIAEPAFDEESRDDSTVSVDSIYSGIKSNTILLEAAKHEPKFSTWTEALAYLKGGANPYGAE